MASPAALRLNRTWRILLTGGKPRWRIEPGGDADRIDALQVRHAVYCQELGYAWVAPDDSFDPRANLCVVRAPDGRPIASLRILGPDDRPFEIDGFVDTSDVLALDSRPAEINRFCILPDFRRLSSSVHLALFQFMFDLALRERYSHFILASKPAVQPIYEYLRFRVVPGKAFRHTTIGNALHNVLLLDLKDVWTRYQDSHHSFAHLLPRGDPSQSK